MSNTNSALSYRTSAGRLALAALAGVALFPLPALSESEDASDVLNDPFAIELGTYLVAADTTVRVDGTAGQGTPVDLNHTFGSGDVSRIRFDGQWRFAEKHKLRALIFDYSRSQSKTISEDIEFGGETFPIDARVTAESKFSIYELGYEYAFLRRENYEVSGSFGLHYADFKLSLSATNPETSQRISREASVGAPLPVFGLRGTWKLPHNLAIDLSGQFFSLTYGDYSGDVQDYRAVLVWQPKKWLGAGIGYDRFKVNVDVNTDKFDGNLNWTYQGPMIFYRASF